MSSSKRHVIAASHRQPVRDAVPVGPVRGNERLEVTLRLRPAAPLPTSGDTFRDRVPHQRRYLSREAYAQAHGASADDIATVTAFAQAEGLAVVEADAARRTVVLSGTAETMMRAFDVKLERYSCPGGTYRGRVGPVSVPTELAGVVEGVFGLDDRPQASPRFRRRMRAAVSDVSYTPLQLATLYGFPTAGDGSGQCIGIVELGGGFRPADISAYFGKLGLATPQVIAVSVDQGKNAPSSSDGPDGEVMLDIEVAAGVAPGATVVVYFAPNSDQGFLDAITTAVHDATHKPSVISISWGGPESSWTSQAMTQMDQAFQAAATMGVTVCVASGDNGSDDGVGDGADHVDFPASSPHALACGGTTLRAQATSITSEVVWNGGADGGATGGGVSTTFPAPSYQVQARVSALEGQALAGRGVPDIAADADPATGYQVRVDGADFVIGGTSAVAPLWAGLVALLNQQLGQPVGFLNPLLYGSLSGPGIVNDIVSGSNGDYSARPGWDACTGWGSPNGQGLLQALKTAGTGAREGG